MFYGQTNRPLSQLLEEFLNTPQRRTLNPHDVIVFKIGFFMGIDALCALMDAASKHGDEMAKRVMDDCLTDLEIAKKELGILSAHAEMHRTQ